MKVIVLILLAFPLSSMSYSDEKPQMDCKRIAGSGKMADPDIIRCENKTEVCFIYPSYGINCHLKKAQ